MSNIKVLRCICKSLCIHIDCHIHGENKFLLGRRYYIIENNGEKLYGKVIEIYDKNEVLVLWEDKTETIENASEIKLHTKDRYGNRYFL